MGMTSEGTVSIPLTEFWKLVADYMDSKTAEIQYGVPCVNTLNDTIDIDFAASTEGHPNDWVEKPKASVQWEKLSECKQIPNNIATLMTYFKDKKGVDEEVLRVIEDLKRAVDDISFLFNKTK